ncbi:MAG TPA: hypothetical protein VFB73_13995 [Chloroflexota bacterium]|nr:hypothetical protein [Chloroflexota bacterium]
MRDSAISLPLAVRARRRPLVQLAAAVLVLGTTVFLTATHPGRTAVRTLLFLPEIFPNAPVRPLTLISAPPQCEEVTLAYAGTEALGDLCYPPGPGQYGGVVLSLGVHPLDRHDPFLVRLTDGLARTQLAVLRPQSPDLTAGRIVPREIDGLVAAFRRLQAHPQVDPTRVGLAGFSVGGALSTVAAADPRIRDEVHLVFTFGGYYDALAVLHAITRHEIEHAGVRQPWTPHPWTVYVFAEQLIAALPPGEEQDYLSALLADPEAAAEQAEPPVALSPLGAMVRALLVEGRPIDSEALLAALPPETRERFRWLSPAAHVANLRAMFFIMHDAGDTLIPYTESRKLVENLPPAVPRRYAEFHMFEHVYPRDPGTLIGFIPDLIELYRHLYLVFLALTE